MEFMMDLWMGKPIWMWSIFGSIVTVLLVLDLGVLHRKAHEVTVKESLITTGVYVIVALLFGVWVWQTLGLGHAKEYLTGYIVEQTLSMDNVFVMSLIFGYLGIPKAYQHRVLFWGIVGVILMRGAMIAAGAVLVSQWAWVLYIFAAFLLFTGIKMLVGKHEEMDISKNPILLFLRKHFKLTQELVGQRFFVRLPRSSELKPGEQRKWHMTPLFVALILVEFADLIFAVDSVPAIFAITQDPFIVFTSNIFAILGLRSLYFSLSAMVDRFAYLKVALAWVLIFIGAKVFITPFIPGHKFPSTISLGVTLGILAWGILYSLYKTRKAATPPQA